MAFARRRFSAWIATIAILLAALAPGLSQAFAASQSRPAPWGEICTSTGLQGARGLVSGGDSGGEHEGPMTVHCPFCSNQSGHFALPATPPGCALESNAVAPVPCTSSAGNSPRSACTSPPSRAPPVIS